MFSKSTPPPPPPKFSEGGAMKRILTLTAALVAMLSAPVAAQVPTVEMLAGAINRCSNGCPEAMTGCMQVDQNISIGIGIIEGGIRPPTDIEVRVLAVTRSGHDRFRDYGVPIYIDETDTRTIRSSATVTIPAGSDTKLSPQSTDPICWKNDNLDTGDSEVEIVIVGGVGYRVNPNRNSLRFTIVEDDDCANPGERTVYVPIGGNMNNTCVCRTQTVAEGLYPDQRAARQASGAEWSPSVKDYLRSTADHSNYCPESPYQGPGS